MIRLAAATVLALSAAAAPAQKVIAPAIPVQSQSTAFIKAVNTALELLQARSPQDYEYARKHVGLVREVERWEQVGILVTHTPPVASLRRRDVEASPTWLASTLVHEACHRFQYLRGVERHATRWPPEWEYSGRLAELECLKRQAETLERLNAPQTEIAFLRKADGLHYRSRLRDWRHDPSNYDPRESRPQ